MRSPFHQTFIHSYSPNALGAAALHTSSDPGMYIAVQGYVLGRPMQGPRNNSTLKSCKGAGRMDDRKMEPCVVICIHPMSKVKIHYTSYWGGGRSKISF